jgi:wobble nucleotide-excising tRNase
MLKKIHEIKNIGLFHNATTNQYAFGKHTLIYAENGRGKSTLASVLSSCSNGDASLIDKRKTVDSSVSEVPEVKFEFLNGLQVSFTSGRWSRQQPNLLVFDTDFVERNVYSGVQIRPDQRQNLLDFALGSQSISDKRVIEEATNRASDAQKQIRDVDRELAKYRKDLSLEEFISLPPISDIDQQIEMLQNTLTTAKRSAEVQSRATPSFIPSPNFNFADFLSVLSQTLQDIEIDAEKKVNSHLARYENGFEDWISKGQAYHNDTDCPYCGQSIKDNEIIGAYRKHFNQSYIDFKKKITTLWKNVEALVSDVVVEGWRGRVATNQVIINTWNGHVSPNQIIFDKESALANNVRELRALLSSLASAKQDNPLEFIGTEDDRQNISCFSQRLVREIEAYNQQIGITLDDINRFKSQLQQASVEQIQEQIKRLEITKSRHEQSVIDLISQWKEASTEKTTQDGIKTSAKTRLNSLMTTLIQQYGERINSLLQNFGASFQIAPMSFSYHGGSPRSDYSLILRDTKVNISGEGISFATALSEGDKRTLAFAFFVAKIEADPSLSNSIVVVDDPMCSLDENRKEHTRFILEDIGKRCSQLIVLGHDLYFLRDLQDRLRKSYPRNVSHDVKCFQLKRVGQDGYTNFANFDIDIACESEYYKHHRMLTEFVEGSSTTELIFIAKAIRPLLEGYLHRRFPNCIDRGLLFGSIIDKIRNSPPNKPLSYVESPVINELNAINSYAGQFHHDTNPSPNPVRIRDTELKTFAERALKIVHKGSP